jgi:hypothetical protein
MSKLVNFFGLLVIPLIVVWLTTYVQKKAEIVYVLSEQIPYLDNESKGTQDLVQKLEVKNIGEIEAKRIIVKINGQVVGWNVKKFLEKDTVETEVTQNGTEVIYQTLSPTGSFQVLWRSRPGTVANRVVVLYEGGIGKEALSKHDQSIPWLWIFFIAAPVAIWLSVRDAKNEKRNTFKSWEYRNISAKALWEAKRPWLLNEAEWDDVLYKVTVSRVEEGGYIFGRDPAKSFAFQLVDDPETIPFEGVKKVQLLVKATEKLVDYYEYQINRSWSAADVEATIARMPAGLPEVTLLEIYSKANGKWREKAVDRYMFSQSIAQIFARVKPVFFSDSQWLLFHSDLRKSLVEKLLVMIATSDSPSTAVSDADISLLVADDVERLRIAQSNRDQQIKRKFAETEFQDAIESLMSGKTFVQLDLRHQSSNQASRIERFSKDVARANSLDAREDALAAEEKRLVQKKNTVETQKNLTDAKLRLIHEVLTDPSAISRIEAETSIFASGNLSNLTRLAKLHHTG